IYLGPEERGYTAVLGSWANRLPPGMTPTVFESSAPDQVRVWGLSSPQAAVAYLHHYKTHDAPMKDLRIHAEIPALSTGVYRYVWIDPATGTITPADTSSSWITVPDFTVDLALMVTRIVK